MIVAHFPCPFCTSQIPSEAICCPQCGRDVSGVRLLSLRLQRLEYRFDALIDRLEVKASSQPVEAEQTNHPERSEVGIPEPHLRASRRPAWLLLTVFLCCSLIIFSHWLMLFVFDVPTIALRISTIIFPMAFGFFGALLSGEKMLGFQVAGFLVGVVSVAGMNGVTAYLDDEEWWPSSHRDQREAIEYVVAIWLGFSTGLFLLKAVRRLRNRDQTVESETTLYMSSSGNVLRAIFKRFEGPIAALTPVLSAGSAIYSGLRAFFEGL